MSSLRASSTPRRKWRKHAKICRKIRAFPIVATRPSWRCKLGLLYNYYNSPFALPNCSLYRFTNFQKNTWQVFAKNIYLRSWKSSCPNVADFVSTDILAQIAQSVEQRTENPRVGGSIPSLGISCVSWCGCSSMVEHQPSKLNTWVRFPSPAGFTSFVRYAVYMREWLSGRASPCQGEGREFESHFALHQKHLGKPVNAGFLLALRSACDGNWWKWIMDFPL